jgi:hypothetical protein
MHVIHTIKYKNTHIKFEYVKCVCVCVCVCVRARGVCVRV